VRARHLHARVGAGGRRAGSDAAITRKAHNWTSTAFQCARLTGDGIKVGCFRHYCGKPTTLISGARLAGRLTRTARLPRGCHHPGSRRGWLADREASQYAVNRSFDFGRRLGHRAGDDVASAVSFADLG